MIGGQHPRRIGNKRGKPPERSLAVEETVVPAPANQTNREEAIFIIVSVSFYTAVPFYVPNWPKALRNQS